MTTAGGGTEQRLDPSMAGHCSMKHIVSSPPKLLLLVPYCLNTLPTDTTSMHPSGLHYTLMYFLLLCMKRERHGGGGGITVIPSPPYKQAFK